jgi:ABC-type antimicrobial peptide transport system permease subunit
VLILVGAAAGTLAAMLPARRAAQMDVLGALAYE